MYFDIRLRSGGAQPVFVELNVIGKLRRSFICVEML